MQQWISRLIQRLLSTPLWGQHCNFLEGNDCFHFKAAFKYSARWAPMMVNQWCDGFKYLLLNGTDMFLPLIPCLFLELRGKHNMELASWQLLPKRVVQLHWFLALSALQRTWLQGQHWAATTVRTHHPWQSWKRKENRSSGETVWERIAMIFCGFRCAPLVLKQCNLNGSTT